jgi:hypothetical protein
VATKFACACSLFAVASRFSATLQYVPPERRQTHTTQLCVIQIYSRENIKSDVAKQEQDKWTNWTTYCVESRILGCYAIGSVRVDVTEEYIASIIRLTRIEQR